MSGFSSVLDHCAMEHRGPYWFNEASLEHNSFSVLVALRLDGIGEANGIKHVE